MNFAGVFTSGHHVQHVFLADHMLYSQFHNIARVPIDNIISCSRSESRSLLHHPRQSSHIISGILLKLQTVQKGKN